MPSTPDPNEDPVEELRDPRTGELVSTAARYQAGPSAKLLREEEYDPQGPLSCPSCGWTGTVDDAEHETYTELFDVSCPKCQKMLLIVSYSDSTEAD